MDRQYPNHHHSLFSTSHLPPIQLPPPNNSSFRGNALPPLEPNRFPPATYHPSLSPPSTNHLPWPTHRRSDSKPQILNPTNEPPSRSRPSQPVPEFSSSKDNDDGMPPTSDFVKKLYKMLQDNAFSDIVCWGPGGDCFIIKDMTEFTKSILPKMFKHSNFASFVRQLNKYDFHKVKNNEENTFGDHSWTFRHPDFQADRRDALENIKRKVPAQRKSSSAKAAAAAATSNTPASPASAASPPDNSAVHSLQSQIDRLTRTVDDMSSHIRSLERNYQNVLNEMVNFQRNMAQQDGLMQNLIQYFLQIENGKQQQQQQQQQRQQQEPAQGRPVISPSPANEQSLGENQFLPASEAQRIMGGSFPETKIARATFEQMNEIARRANTAGMQFTGPGTPPVSVGSPMNGGGNINTTCSTSPLTQQDALKRIEELQRARPSSTSPPEATQIQDPAPQTSNYADSVVPGLQQNRSNGAGEDDGPFPGLQVFTVGHLLPRSSADPEDGTWSFDPAVLQIPVQPSATTSSPPANSANAVASAPSASSSSYAVVKQRSPTPQWLRVRRQTYVPGWAVPPRVLLVEDDAVSRKLSSKFLQVFGCTIDVAVDGVGAVNKMNLEKYDLVLMDIVMPKLDGVSATSLIRQFDPMTPIISMTSNSKPNEIMTYFSSGMNDILPKPFTKEGLFDMLEKHLMHLKVIQEMSKVPRSLSDNSFQEVVPAAFNNQGASSSSSTIMAPIPLPPMTDKDARINPIAVLGLSDEQYIEILQTMVDTDTFGGEDMTGRARITAADPEDEMVNSSVTLGKRPLDEPTVTREEKRSRFQVIE